MASTDLFGAGASGAGGVGAMGASTSDRPLRSMSLQHPPRPTMPWPFNPSSPKFVRRYDQERTGELDGRVVVR